MSALAYTVLALLAVNSLFSVSDYYARVTTLKTPENIPAAVMQYSMPGKEYYLSSLRTAWEKAADAKREAGNMLEVYIKESLSNLAFSSYCRSKLSEVYGYAGSAFYATVSLLERDAAVLRDAGVENPKYSGRARPVYLSLLQAVSAVEHPDNLSSSESSRRIREGLKAGNSDYFNALVGYPDGLFRVMLDEHRMFLLALDYLDAEYKQALAEVEYRNRLLSYRAREYEANRLDEVAWNRIRLRGGILSGESSPENPARAYQTAREWSLKTTAVTGSARALYSAGRKADAIVLLHDHCLETEKVIRALEGAVEAARAVEEQLHRRAVKAFSSASRESAGYSLAEKACSEQSPLLGESILLLQKCIRLSEKTREPDPSSLEGEELADNLSRLAWDKYYQLEQYLDDPVFLDRIRTSLQLLDASSDDPLQAAAGYQKLVLEMDEKRAGLESEYSVVLESRVLDCGKEQEVNATVYFSGPRTSVYRARVFLPERVAFPDGSKSKILSSENQSLKIPVHVSPECVKVSEEQVKADDTRVYYEEEWKVRSPLPVRLADGTVTASLAKVLVSRPSWLVVGRKEQGSMLVLTVFNPGDTLKNVVLSADTTREVEECSSCILRQGKVLFFIPLVRGGEKKVLEARLSGNRTNALSESVPEEQEDYKNTLLLGPLNTSGYNAFIESRVFAPAADAGSEGTNITLQGEGKKDIVQRRNVLKPVSLEAREAREPDERSSGNSYKYYVIPLGFAVLSFMLLKRKPARKKIGRVI